MELGSLTLSLALPIRLLIDFVVKLSVNRSTVSPTIRHVCRNRMSMKAKSIHETPDLKMAPPIGIKEISHMQYMKLMLIQIQLKKRNRTSICSCCHFATLSNIAEDIKKLWKILPILNNLVPF
jgi:hypothetical protein